jgi:F-box/leucine-rich repeat protein 6
VTRLTGSGLELIAQKWSHSLIEVDLAWSTATQALDLAVTALAEQGAESPLRYIAYLFI